MELGDAIGAVVVNVGHWETKAGEAGEDTPKCVFPTFVGCVDPSSQPTLYGKGGQHQPMEVENGASHKTYYVGTNHTNYRDFMTMDSPLRDGKVVDWDLHQQILEYAFSQGLQINPSEHPLLFTEPSNNTSDQRQKLTQLLFEKYRPPGIFIAKEATLSCYASGRATSLVVDSGANRTLVTAVHDGYVLQKSIQESKVAGNYISTLLMNALRDKLKRDLNPKFMYSKSHLAHGNKVVNQIDRASCTLSYLHHHQQHLMDDIKKNICLVSEEPVETIPPASAIEYELPDGTIITPTHERFGAPELMFRAADGVPSLPQLVSSCVTGCDVDIRRELYGGIIVTGGNTLFSGFSERLAKSIHAPTMYKVKLISHDPVERKFSSWIGGSILGSLPAMSSLWISPEEFDEKGAHIVDRKCP